MFILSVYRSDTHFNWMRYFTAVILQVDSVDRVCGKNGHDVVNKDDAKLAKSTTTPHPAIQTPLQSDESCKKHLIERDH